MASAAAAAISASDSAGVPASCAAMPDQSRASSMMPISLARAGDDEDGRHHQQQRDHRREVATAERVGGLP